MKLARSFIDDIRALILSARATVSRGVDLVQVQTNFLIGMRMVEEEQRGKDRAAYGEKVLDALADRLAIEFGHGFSRSNLAYMRRFYLMFQDRASIVQSVTGQLQSARKIVQSPTGQSGKNRKLQTVSAKSARVEKGGSLTGQFEIVKAASGEPSTAQPVPLRPFTLSWTHYVFLLGVKNSDERSFYEIESAAQNWGVRELKRQFDSSLYERLALSRDKKGIRDLARQGQTIERPQDLLKEPLVLEFLGLDEKRRYSESDLESAIISQIERFLLELGKGFLFEARQRRFTFGGEHYHVDLVFYNRLLRCYVLIDLKIGRLTHQDLGQMQMYVNYYDRNIKIDGENSTIGIVLCKLQNKAVVEITLPKDANIHAREYRLYLPSKEQLRKKLVEWTKAGEVGNE